MGDARFEKHESTRILMEDTVAYMHPSALAVLVVMREARAIMQPPFETKSTLNAIKCH